MMMYREAEGYLGGLYYFNYAHTPPGGLPHVCGVCSIFFFDVVSDGGKVFVYTVFCKGNHVFLLLDSGCSRSAVLSALVMKQES
jgi:hypothetical protein